MNSIDIKIKKFLRKAGLRIKINMLLNNTILGLIISLALSSIILLIALFVPFYESTIIAISILSIGFLASIIFSIVKFPNKKTQALIVDSTGLKERVSTSLEFLGKEEGFYTMQKLDTVKALEGYDLKESLPIKVNLKKVVMVLCLIAVFSIGLFLPTEAKIVAKQNHELKVAKKELKKKLEEKKEEVKKLDKLKEEEKAKLIEALDKAEKDIKLAESKKDIEKTLESLDKKLENQEKELKDNKEAMQALKDIRKDINPKAEQSREEKAKEDIKKLTDMLSKSEKTEDLAKALQSGDKDKVEKALSDIKGNMDKMGELEKSAVSSALKEAAGNLNNDKLASALKNASRDAKSGNLEASEGELKEALGELMEESGASQSLAEGGGNNQSNSGQSSGEGNGSGEGSGNGNGQGNGNGSGNGSGSGDGNGGGWNQGSKKGLNKPGSGSTKEKEQVYIPGRNTGSDENLTGAKNGDSSQIVNSKDNLTLRGESVDYEEVIGEYSRDAYENINNSPIPEGLKGIIKSYFEGLQE